jgi:hypothetical protein
MKVVTIDVTVCSLVLLVVGVNIYILLICGLENSSLVLSSCGVEVKVQYSPGDLGQKL